MPYIRRFRVPFVLHVVLLSAVATCVSATLLEKIFIHDREDVDNAVKRLPRLELDPSTVDQLRRAYDEIKESIPTYTGYFFLDFVFEFVKTTIVFLVALLIPPPDKAI